MAGWRRDLGLSAAPQELDGLRTAIGKERSTSLRPTDVRIVQVHPVDGEDGGLWELVVEAAAPLPPARAWSDATLKRELLGADGAPFHVQILDVDPEVGRLFVEGEEPTPGMAQVWPFDFLASLSRVLDTARYRPFHPELAVLAAAVLGAGTPSARPAPHNHPAWGWSWVHVWGPPGTGKTWTLGQQVAALLRDPDERVLVLSTTNRATDAAALELGRALKADGQDVGNALRAGRVVHSAPFRREGLDRMLPAADVLEAVERGLLAADGLGPGIERTQARLDLRRAWRRLPTLRTTAHDPRRRVLVSTLHAGTALLTEEATTVLLEQGLAPFTTVVLDEAGLVGRGHVAAVALLASRRVVVVGDPRQLSPIARAARTLPRPVVTWLARSALDHLDVDHLEPSTQLLPTQRRMHPDIGEAVSALQYDGRLQHHPVVVERPWPGAGTLLNLPRVLWYVIDAHPDLGVDGAASHRGRGGSRVRGATEAVLQALVQAQPELTDVRGLFISPYKAQAAEAHGWLKRCGLTGWAASTVHSQQGAEADVVIFDTVHASSTGWPPAEWCRLVNVGLSRARQLVILVASREEVDQPWMRPLRPHLQARVLERHGEGWRWTEPQAQAAQASLFGRPAVSERPRGAAGGGQLEVGGGAAGIGPGDLGGSSGVGGSNGAAGAGDGASLGSQIARRRVLRPVLSRDQQRLVARTLADAGPRLVRGVAGSGKTLVLAHWAVRTLRGQGFDQVVVVYANAALKPLILRMLDEAWVAQHGESAPAFPYERVTCMHIADLLQDLRQGCGLREPTDRWDYEAQAEAILEAASVQARFPAVFVDEAQDLGHSGLRLLTELTVPRDGKRPVLVFYDNAQNVYRRRAPRWAALGLDMRGRSDVMRESFRSSRPIVEVALNVVDRLTGMVDSDPDFRELQHDKVLQRGLRAGQTWWQARFCADDGELPELHIAESQADEVAWVVERMRTLLLDEGVRPGDVRIVTLSKTLRKDLQRALAKAGVPVVERASQGFEGCDGSVVITTPQSFKGYDAEVVIVPGVDRFAPAGNLEAQALYVALTRARTVLIASATRASGGWGPKRELVDALSAVREQLGDGEGVRAREGGAGEDGAGGAGDGGPGDGGPPRA